MLKNILSRHAIAFLTIGLSSTCMYLTAGAGADLATWALLSLVLLATFLTMMTK